MKRTIVSLAIAAAMTTPAAFAGSDVKVYGKINVSLDHDQIDPKAGDKYKETLLNTNSSRLGVKAKTELTEGLTGIVKLEYELKSFNGDDSTSAPFKARDSFVGLTGNWGTLRLGYFDSPLKKAQGKVDMFNDRNQLDLKNYLSDSEQRIANSINYMLPDFSGFSGQVTVAPGEDADTVTDGRDGVADSISASLYYKTKPLFVALGYDNDVLTKDKDGNKNFKNTVRFTATYKIAGFMIGGMVEQSEFNKDPGYDTKGTGFLLSGSYTIAKAHKVKIQGSVSDVKDKSLNDKDGSHTMYALGYDYKIAKPTSVYVQVGQVTDEDDDGTTKSEEKITTFGLGMVHKF